MMNELRIKNNSKQMVYITKISYALSSDFFPYYENGETARESECE